MSFDISLHHLSKTNGKDNNKERRRFFAILHILKRKDSRSSLFFQI